MRKLLFTISALLALNTVSNAQGWTILGNVPGTGAINCLTVNSSGTLYAGGEFGNELLKWNGTTWDIVSGPNSRVYAIKSSANNMYAAGILFDANSWLAVGRWDGSNWSYLGQLVNQGHYIWALTTDAAGNVYVGGNFTNTNSHCYVAKWNGATWTELGGLDGLMTSSGVIYSLTTDASGNVYAAGDFEDATGHTYVAKFNGTSWSKFGTGLNFLDPVRALAFDGSGNLYAAGDLLSASGHFVAKCTGGNWTNIGLNANGDVYALAISGNNVYAAGEFTNASGKEYVAKYNGTSWVELSGSSPLNANGRINGLATDASGNVYASGAFIDGNGKTFVAKFGNTTGIESVNEISSLRCLPNYGSGIFNVTASGIKTQNVNISVYNSVGVIVKSYQCSAGQGNLNQQINLTEQASGTYIIIVNNGTETGKAYVQKW